MSVGEYIIPGQALVGLDAIDQIKVDFKVPEKYLPTVHTGQSIEIKVDAYPGETFKGEVYAIDPRVDIEGRSIFIRARVPRRRSEAPAWPVRPRDADPRGEARRADRAGGRHRAKGRGPIRLQGGRRKAQLSRVSIGTRREAASSWSKGWRPASS